MDGGSKKQRTQFSPKQMLYLEEKFHEKEFPTTTERENMAKLLDLSQQVIQIWFQNRRAKERKKKRKYESVLHLKHQPKPPPFWPQNLPFHSNFTSEVKTDVTTTEHSEEPRSSEDAESSTTDQTLADSIPLDTPPPSAVSSSHKQSSPSAEQSSTNTRVLSPTPILTASPPSPAAGHVEATPIQPWVQPQPLVCTDFSSPTFLQTSPPVAVGGVEHPIHMVRNPRRAGEDSLPGQACRGAGRVRAESVQLMRVEESLLCVAEPVSVRLEENQALLSPFTRSSHEVLLGHLDCRPPESTLPATGGSSAPNASGQYRHRGAALSSTASSLMAKASSSMNSQDDSSFQLATSQGAGVSSSSSPQPVVSMDATLPQWGREPPIQSPTGRASISSGVSDGNLSLSSALSDSSHLEVPEARQMETFSLEDFSKFAPIFAEEPIALSDILDSQEWDLMERTPITTSHQMHPQAVHGPPHQPYGRMAHPLSPPFTPLLAPSMSSPGPPPFPGADLQTVYPHGPYPTPDHHGELMPSSSAQPCVHQATFYGTSHQLTTNGYPSTFSRQ